MRIAKLRPGGQEITPPRRRNNRKRRDWNKILRRASFVALAVEIGIVCFANPYLRVTRVRVEGVKTLSTEHVFHEAKVPRRENIFWMALREPFAKRLAADPVIDHVSRGISLPRTLVLRITERQPYALLRTDDKYLVLDRKGMPFRRVSAPQPGLPILEWTGDTTNVAFEVGEPIRAQWLKDAYGLLALVADKKNLAVASVEVDQNANLCLNRLDHLQIKLGQPDALPQKIALAQATMAANGGEIVSRAAYIDVSCPERPAWMPRAANGGKEGSDGTVSDSAKQPAGTSGAGDSTTLRTDPSLRAVSGTRREPGQ